MPGEYVIGRITLGQRRGVAALGGPPVGQVHAVPAGEADGATTLCGITVQYVADEHFPPVTGSGRPPVCEVCWGLYYTGAGAARSSPPGP